MSTGEADESDRTPAGDEIRTGWQALTHNDSVPCIVDALLDQPAHREFNQTELADLADVSRQSVARHLDLLLAAEIVEPVENTRPQRYRFDEDSRVSRALIELDGAMNEVGQRWEQ